MSISSRSGCVDLTMQVDKPKPDYNERFKLRGASFEDVVRRAINEPNGKNGHSDHDQLEAIAQLVHDRRIELGWSRRRLATIAHVDQATVKHLEDGDRLPRRQTLAKMATALEVSL